MRILIAATAVVLILAVTPAQAQHVGHGLHGGSSPYAGWQTREIKMLSDDQIADLQAGRGMSLALSAELNGYPGPTHVLELADHLQLSAGQREKTETLLAEMKKESIALGAELMEAERGIDALFGAVIPTEQALRDATAMAAAVQGRLRFAHLRYHLRTMQILNPAQVEAYNRLRGYR